MEIVTRKEAARQGLTRYYTGKPCSHGHDAERYTHITRCVECHMLRCTTQRKKKFTPTQYNTMLEAQHNKCALCLTEFGTHRPVIDHCHTTGEIRAVLCLLCNTMLGAAKDNPDTLRAGAKYLELFRE
jgi:hypothetical protein